MGKKRKIIIILEKSISGYSAYTKEFSRLYVTGSSVQEVKENILEAMEARLIQLEEKGSTAKAELLRNSEVAYVLQV